MWYFWNPLFGKSETHVTNHNLETTLTYVLGTFWFSENASRKWSYSRDRLSLLVPKYGRTWPVQKSNKLSVSILQGWCIEIMFSVVLGTLINFKCRPPTTMAPCMLSCRPWPTSLHGCGLWRRQPREELRPQVSMARAARALLWPGAQFHGSFRQRHWSEPLVHARFLIAFCFFSFLLLQVILTLNPLVQNHKSSSTLQQQRSSPPVQKMHHRRFGPYWI